MPLATQPWKKSTRRAAVTGMLALACALSAHAGDAPPLVPEAAIALPHTSGRIDHLAIDLGRKRLFVAELGNGSVDVVDLDKQQVIHRLTGLREPQGVLYAPSADRLVVASAGDGTLRLFSARTVLPCRASSVSAMMPTMSGLDRTDTMCWSGMAMAVWRWSIWRRARFA